MSRSRSSYCPERGPGLLPVRAHYPINGDKLQGLSFGYERFNWYVAPVTGLSATPRLFANPLALAWITPAVFALGETRRATIATATRSAAIVSRNRKKSLSIVAGLRPQFEPRAAFELRKPRRQVIIGVRQIQQDG